MIDRIWINDLLERLRLLELAQMANVEGVYECWAEKGSLNMTVHQMGVQYEIMRSPGMNVPIFYIESFPS